MEWTQEAEEALSRVPFSIREKVRAGVEEEVQKAGSKRVSRDHVQTTQKRFRNTLEQEVRGFQVETCFGITGCPNRTVDPSGMAQTLEQILQIRDLKRFLKERVQGPLKIHHEFRLSLSCCPNACSRPQIVDLGIIGAQSPHVTEEACHLCRVCLEVCQEQAILLEEGEEKPAIDKKKCLFCGQCIKVCPTGTIQKEQEGFRLLVGGKLGRHPQLAEDRGRIFSRENLFAEINAYLDLYQAHNKKGERLGEILNRLKTENTPPTNPPSSED